MELGQIIIILNIPHSLVLLHIHAESTRSFFSAPNRESRGILSIDAWTLPPPPPAQHVTAPKGSVAHLDSTMRSLHSYLLCTGLSKMPKLLNTATAQQNQPESVAKTGLINKNYKREKISWDCPLTSFRHWSPTWTFWQCRRHQDTWGSWTLQSWPR